MPQTPKPRPRIRVEAGYTHPGSELTEEEIAFGQAMHEFQVRHDVRYPSWSQILYVLQSLGYRKRITTPATPDDNSTRG